MKIHSFHSSFKKVCCPKTTKKKKLSRWSCGESIARKKNSICATCKCTSFSFIFVQTHRIVWVLRLALCEWIVVNFMCACTFICIIVCTNCKKQERQDDDFLEKVIIL